MILQALKILLFWKRPSIQLTLIRILFAEKSRVSAFAVPDAEHLELKHKAIDRLDATIK